MITGLMEIIKKTKTGIEIDIRIDLMEEEPDQLMGGRTKESDEGC
jgi:hypothetical protein